ncbi:MAG: cytochrome C554 [Ignavibacteria bacterium RIFOXYA2_FULL_37_17]|nr:MAG: cytochrome C554 [Ignavibacteria bacterium RIFOXYA2_FULL_37_17]
MSHKKAVLFFFILAAYLVLPTSSSQAQPYGYEGAQVCGMCHKTEKQGQQLKIWSGSKHAQAYKVLQSDKANEIAMKKFNKKAVDAPECLKCHASGYNVDKALVGTKFKVEDGVQCETCHGPGSGYKAMAVMKNKEESKKKGLMVHDDVAKFCKTCHNSESPTFKDFKYDEMWKKIAHSVPKG